MTIVVARANMIDGNGGPPIAASNVIIEGDRIALVGPAARTPVPPGAQVINATGKTVMPGLVDSHIHICGEFAPTPMNPLTSLPSYGAIRGVAAAKRLLDMGFTACRAMGDGLYANVALKQAVDSGLVPGPRMVTAAYMIRVIGNARDWIPPNIYAPGPGMFTGADAGREEVRTNLLNGADFIETQVAGAVGSSAPTPLDVTEWSMAEMEAVVDEAHRQGKLIGANCYGDDSVERCAKAGFDAIEHGCLVTERGIAAMVEHDMLMIPTLCAYNAYLGEEAEGQYPAWRLAKGRPVATVLRNTFPKYLEMGLKVVGGSDGSGPGVGRRPGEGALELELMVSYGMSPTQAISANTKMGAHAMGMAEDFGTLEAGKLADLIVVDGDPLSDIRILQDRERIQLVMKGGEVVRSDLRGAP